MVDELARIELALTQAQSCINGETPEDITFGEAEDDTFSKIRGALDDVAELRRLAATPPDPDAMNAKRALDDANLASNVREACVKCVPTNWHDPLLTGPDVPRNLPFSNRDVEQLLRGIQDRIRALPTTGKPKP